MTSSLLDGLQPLHRDESEEMLPGLESWKPPADSNGQVSIWFDATEDGEQALYGLMGRS